MSNSWEQVTITLNPRSKGCYLVTDEVVSKLPQLQHYKVGLLNLFIQHTSAGLTLNENCDPDVRADMSDQLDIIVPEHDDYRHLDEGSDDMPSHLKSTIVGLSICIPIANGRLKTGTWQGVWLTEFRRMRHTRRVVATINGLKE